MKLSLKLIYNGSLNHVALRFLSGIAAPPRNIVLAGAPGSGKTTVAKMLGEKLGWEVVDIDDDYLEPFWGMAVADKVKELEPQGYETIQQAESDAFCQLRLPKDKGYIISLTGSVPLCPRAAQHMRTLGSTIYIDVQSDDIIERALVPKNADKNEVFAQVMDCVQRMSRPETYVSTRHPQNEEDSEPSNLSFLDVILESVASDGGLYCPNVKFTPFSESHLERLADLPWVDLITRVQERLIDPLAVSPQNLKNIIGQAYQSFADPANPIKIQKLTDNTFVSELFHGPTASFKDFPLQQLPHFYKLALETNSVKQRILILVATSGDTGGATLDGFQRLQATSDSDQMRTMVLYPFSNVSKIQQSQMIHYHNPPLSEVYGVQGNFDDCQQLVKRFFRKQAASDLQNGSYRLCSANSVNWGRIIGQIGMQFGSYFQLVQRGLIDVGSPVDLSIPSGNFGNIYSAFLAQKMGLPIRRLIMASNENNVLTDFVHIGSLDIKRDLVSTTSPAIDILQPSNLERFIFDVTHQNSVVVRNYYSSLRRKRIFKLPGRMLESIQTILRADCCFQYDAEKAQHRVAREYNYRIDPHTAVSYDVGLRNRDPNTPLVVFSTAHPGKFPSSVGTDVTEPVNHSGLEKLSKTQKPVSPHTLLDIEKTIQGLSG
ncbi:threonine synthase-like 1 isoform X2 [Symsagittifera roscoffensis]|uniref:threonine synthase-like 1 isoform X2 n=1 Tax=Symsagittifera roscoffensis TaxID=84072 RepID=UPI00307B92B5